ncbi:ComF family protein [Marinobacter sp. CA1]|uniref:ComF family protein n=1 Tax=Marinobacter sp. CA1 TaxID=2817656 RepID=UPI001D06796B|nr:ComF family protein [Marinobacter sp. CA1]UDL06568.1 ComF family protein [Marinobacter sp. CA1]
MIKGLRALSTHFPPLVNRVLDAGNLCVACLAPAPTGLCQACFDALPVNRTPCRCCALPLPASTPAAALCGDCQARPPHFRHTIAPWLYGFPVDQLISGYKYRRQPSLGHPLVQAWLAQFRVSLMPSGELPQLLIPTPMRPWRQRRRGFNQAEDIAEQLGRHLDLPWSASTVRRVGPQQPQAGLQRRQRLRNLGTAFQVLGPVPDRVAIVDDVMTTGATARAMARALSRAGASDIQVWALARTPLG